MASSSFYSGSSQDATNVNAVEDSKNAAALSEAAAAASATAAANSAASGASSASTATTKASESAGSATASATSAAASEVSRLASETAKVASETAKTAAETARDAAASSSTAATASQAAASSSETNAATSEAAALVSKNAAATSASTAAAEAANSATSAAASEVSNVASGVAKVAAETAEANAETAQAASEAARDAAAVSQAAAATSENNAASSAATAATQAGIATTKAGEAAASATASANSATASEAAKDAALAALDSFDDRYLGQKTADPTVDNDGDALVSGSLYFNTTDDIMKVYDGSQWVAAYASLSGAMLSVNNLSDVASISASRTNLGLGTAATAAATDFVAVTGDTMTGPLDVQSTITSDGLTVDLGSTSDVTVNSTDGGGIQFNYGGVNQFRIDSASNDGGLYHTPTGKNHTFKTDGANRLKIATGGDISFYNSAGTSAQMVWDASEESLGIGGAPSAKLDINQLSAATGLEVYVNDVGTSRIADLKGYDNVLGVVSRMVVQANGNVGIGTDSPSRKVSAFDSVDGYNLELSQTSAYNSGYQSGIVFSAKYNTGGSVTDLASIRGGKENTTNDNWAGNLRFYTRTHNGSDTERLRIDSSGTLITKGAAVFNEDGADKDFRVESDSNTHALFVDASSSRVGINKSSLVADLDVGGSIRVDNSQTLNVDTNLSAGEMSMGQVVDSGGWGLVGLGWAGGAAGQTASFGYAGQTMYFGLGDGSNSGSLSAILQMSRTNGEVVFNNNSYDIDFRVESDSNANAFVVDAGTSIVRIGAGSDVANNSQPKLSVTTPWKASSSGDYDGTLSLVATGGGSSGGRGSNIIFTGEDGLSTRTFAKIDSFKENSTSGDHDGALVFRTRKNNSGLPARLHLLSYAAIFNDDSDDTDFIVESDSHTNALFVDAGNNCVGIKSTNPSGYNSSARDLVIGDGGGRYGMTIATSSTTNGSIFFADGGGTDAYRGYIQYRHGVDDLVLGAVGETMINLADAEVVFNDDSYNRDFRVESNASTHAIYVDAGDNKISLGRATYSSNMPALVSVSNGSGSTAGRNSLDEVYLGLGHDEWTNGGGAYFGIGFGYKGSNTHHPTIIAAKMNESGGGTNNNLIFYNRAALSGTPEERLRFTPNDGAVFNDPSYDYDFRVESNNFGHALFVDAGNDIVNIATSVDYGARLNVQNSDSARNCIRADNTVTNYASYNVWSTFTSSGNINTTAVHFAGYTESGNRFVVYGNGNVANTNNSYGSLSDVRLKENIIDSGSQWDDIKALTVRKYSLKEDNLDAPNMLGVIAQEVEAAGMGGLVYETPDRDQEGEFTGTSTKQVNYSILYMKAVKALQEAIDRIETLEAKVTALENA